MAEFERLIDFYKPRKSKPGWEWKRLYSTPTADYSDNTTKEQIWSQLDKMFAEVLQVEKELASSMTEGNA